MHEPRVERLRGGLRLMPNKAASTSRPVAQGFQPKRLIIAMRQHRGHPATPVVSVGETVRQGQLIGAAGAAPSASVHASRGGLVRSIEERWVPGGSQLHRSACVVIEPCDEQSDATPSGPAWPGQDRCAAFEQLREAGIVGLGGAAFPTADKLQGDVTPRALLLNGAECEPYISCDDMLMREAPEQILDGALALADLIGAPAVFVAIERDKPAAINAMTAAANQCNDPRIRIVGIPSIYPAGGERQLVALLTGAEVPSGCYPSEIGYPCQNVGTAYAVHRWVRAREPLTSRVITVSGNGVHSPRNVAVPVGSLVSELIEFCGGFSPPVERLILGGSMMGYAVTTDDLPITKSTNCIVAARAQEVHCGARQWPCIRCGECAAACPASLLPQELIAADLESQLQLHLTDCIECGCCDVVCPSHIPITQLLRAGKTELRRHVSHTRLSEDAEQRARRKSERRRLDDEAFLQQQDQLKAGASAQAIRDAVARAKQQRARTPAGS